MRQKEKLDAQINMSIIAIDATTDEATYALSGMIMEDHYFNEGLQSDYNDCYHLYKGKQPIGFWGSEIHEMLNIDEDE